MGSLADRLKRNWLLMLEPPWRHVEPDEKYDNGRHWVIWLVGWAWALAGLVLGAVVAPSLVQFAGLSNSPYQDWLVIAIAVSAGFLVQLLGWCLVTVLNWSRMRVFLLADLLPLAGVCYGIYRYLEWVGVRQRSVTVAFVGGLLIKAFLIPLIKGIVTGAALKWFIGWLRGDKVKPRGA